MNAPQHTGLERAWPGDGEVATRVPSYVYTDPDIYALEQERIFRGPVWNFVGLEDEVRRPGDYKSTLIGDTPVVIARDAAGELHAWVNRCAHRGALVCRELRGNAETFTCVYHQWSYDAAGRLIGVPFRKGLSGKGGYPADFDLAAHGLRELRIETFQGTLFVSFSEQTPPLEQYIGPQTAHHMARIFNRPVTLLGTHRQYMKGNWKLYAENPRDGYHASLLHLFFPTFGLFRASQQAHVMVENEGLNTCLYVYSKKEDAAVKAETAQQAARTYQEDTYALQDPRLLRSVPEFDDEIDLVIIDVFPIMMMQQLGNCLNIRQFVPHGVDGVEVIYYYFGYHDDTPELTEQRLKQVNLLGPAGLVSLEDGHAIELAHQGNAGYPEMSSFIEMGGREILTDHGFAATEDPVRGFWTGYRRMMGL